jgi:hypothetical protein
VDEGFAEGQLVGLGDQRGKGLGVFDHNGTNRRLAIAAGPTQAIPHADGERWAVVALEEPVEKRLSADLARIGHGISPEFYFSGAAGAPVTLGTESAARSVRGVPN